MKALMICLVIVLVTGLLGFAVMLPGAESNGGEQYYGALQCTGVCVIELPGAFLAHDNCVIEATSDQSFVILDGVASDETIASAKEFISSAEITYMRQELPAPILTVVGLGTVSIGMYYEDDGPPIQSPVGTSSPTGLPPFVTLTTPGPTATNVLPWVTPGTPGTPEPTATSFVPWGTPKPQPSATATPRPPFLPLRSMRPGW